MDDEQDPLDGLHEHSQGSGDFSEKVQENRLPSKLNANFSKPERSSRQNGKATSDKLCKALTESHGSTHDNTTTSTTSLQDSVNEELVVQQLMRRVSHVGNGNDGPKTAANYSSFPSGFQLRNYYEHSKKLTDLVDVTYNPRTKQFIFLDTRGITTWDKDGIEHCVTRSLSYPKYVNNLLKKIIYARKYNVYFCLSKDFSLKVLNKDFYETCNVASDLSSVMFLIFNPVMDELITGGVKGTKVWEFKQVTDQTWKEIKPMANYGLFLKRELSGIKGGWIRKVELEQQLQHLYCCSDTDVLCYNMEGKAVFTLVNAHKSQINGCKFSPQARVLITCSSDSEVKVWSMTGGHVHTFRGHSRSVTGMVLHPETSLLVLTCSMDGTVRMWSLDIMELMYTIVISTEGMEWMGLTGEKFLWTATHRDLSVWHLNHVVQFYALARCRVTALYVTGCKGKTTRLVAVGDDSSVRLVSMKDQKSLSTVLPPPSISPLQQVQAVTYNRQCSTVYLLINPAEIWVYTMRTDPACRTAVWDVERLQDKTNRGQSAASRADSATAKSPRPQPKSRGLSSSVQLGHTFPKHHATLQGRGGQTPALCTSLTTITSPVMYWTEEGFVCPVNCNFLAMGLMDGRILFMDPMEYGRRYCEFQNSKDAILEMVFDSSHSTLITKSHLREEDMFQFWLLPSLELQHLVLVPRDVTGFARLDSVFLTGHSDGALMLHHLKPATSSTIYSSTDIGDAVRERRRDHLAPIVAVDSCPHLEIFVSCSCDGAVKVWDADKLLMTEIALEEPISTARFINAKGDLMLGYMNHLFLIEHGKILSSTSKTQFPDDNLETESEIYEDPAVRYEGAAANPDPLDLRSYLVPYNLDYSERFREGRTSPASSHAFSDKSASDDESSEFSMAPTEVYQSPSMTPRRLSVVDLLTSRQDASKDEISRKMQSLSLTRKRLSKLSKLNPNQEDEHQLVFDMPQFGTSPGPSPTPSPPSSCSEFDISEDESERTISGGGSEGEEEKEKKYDVGSMMIVKTSVADFEQLMKKESQKVQVSDLRPLPEEVSRFSLSRMKIDAKSLLRQRIPGTAAPKTVGSDKISQPLLSSVGEIKTSQHKMQKLAGHRPRTIIKKKHKGIQLRVGERAAVRLVASPAVPSTASTTAAPVTPKPSEPDVTIPAKLTVSLEAGVTDAKQTSPSPSSSATTVQTPKPSESSLKSKPKVEVPALPKVSSLPKEDEGVSGKPADEGSKQRLAKGERKSIFDDWKKPERTKRSPEEANLDTLDKDGQRAISAASSTITVRPASGIRGPDGGGEMRRDQQSQYPDTQESDSLSHSKTSSRLDAKVKSRSHVKTAATFQDKELQTSGILADNQMAKPVADLDEPLPDQIPTSTSEEPNAALLRKIMKSPVALPPRPGKAVGRESVGQGTEQTRVEVFIPTGSVQEQGLAQGGMEGRLARPNTAEGRFLSTQRSHTARGGLHVNFKDGSLVDGLDTPVARHFSCPGSPLDINNIYRNDGLHFEDNWQEKLIVRHQILKWQQEQRAQIAADRRRLLELRKRQRRSALLGHHHCAVADDQTYEDFQHQDVYVTRSDTSLNKLKRCQSAPSRRRVVPLSPPIQPQQACGSKTKEQDLTAERPYRFRISRDPAPNIKPRLPVEDVFEETGPDSSHPGSRLIKRPYSSKSIPSKTRRYVLITKIQEEADYYVPTTLERQLLAERFPQTRLHPLRQLPEPQRRVSTPDLDLINVSSVDDGSYYS